MLVSWLIAGFAVVFFLYLFLFAGLSREERNRVYVMVALFIAYAVFVAGYQQGGGSLNLFAERYTDRNVLGWRMPAGILQATYVFFYNFGCTFARHLVAKAWPARQRFVFAG